MVSISNTCFLLVCPLLGTKDPFADVRDGFQKPQKFLSLGLSLTAFGCWRSPAIGKSWGPFWGPFPKQPVQRLGKALDMALTDTTIRRAKTAETDRKLADEKGLYLLVTTTGSKLWRLKYRADAKEKKLALGA